MSARTLLRSMPPITPTLWIPIALGVVLALIGGTLGWIGFQPPAQAVTQTYAFTGGPQIYVVPLGVTSITVTLNGAQGSTISGKGTGGLGGSVTATISVTPGEVLQVMVGGSAGYNGGGRGGGGGGTDIRRPAFSTSSSCAFTLTCTTSQRIIVAGGGGGAGGVLTGANGGAGGQAASGGTAVNTGSGNATAGGAGTGSAGGAGGGGTFTLTGAPAGTGGFGYGGENSWSTGGFGGGGGGGYYGGGGGGQSSVGGTIDGMAGGGGGSSWAGGTGVSSAVFSDGTVSGNGSVVFDPPSAISDAAFGSNVTEVSVAVTDKMLTSNVATLTTAAAHGFSVNDVVTVTGVANEFNGTFRITAVPSSTEFSYAKTGSDVPFAVVSPNGAAVGDLGTPQFYTVPSGITKVSVRLYGSPGGGQGDIVYGQLPVTSGQVLQLNLGSRGLFQSDYTLRDSSATILGGGWNGGGPGQVGWGGSGSGGGGASDVRMCASPTLGTPCSLSDRVVVAGGGGGASVAGWGLAGGTGGGQSDGSGSNGSGGAFAYGGTLTAGGAGTGTGTSGSFGFGGVGQNGFPGSGGGGGGYYGGGGSEGSGGGGGSSYASVTGAGGSNVLGASGAAFAHDRGGSSGNGMAVIVAMPIPVTGSSSSITSTSAAIDGTINPEFLATTPKVYWSTSQSTLEAGGGSSASITGPASAATIAGNSALAVSGSITGLANGTTYYWRICAQSVAGLACGNTANFTTLPALYVATSTPMNPGWVSTAYSQTLAGGGGSGVYSSWAVTSGSLPAGLTLNTSTGEISGTPTTTGTASFTVRVTDSLSATASKAMSIQIYPALSITTSSLPYGIVGTAYSQTLAASGGSGAYTAWAVTSGSLPTGLTLDTSTGAITGTPTTSGSSTVTFQVTDSAGGTATRSLTIAIYDPVSVTTSSLSAGHVGTAYSQSLAATGGDGSYTWSVISGSLPGGLSVSGGAITGTPTTAGTYTFTVQATDGVGEIGTRSLSITVYTAVTITTTSLGFGQVGSAFSQTMSATGGTGTYTTWTISAGSLPPGLTIGAGTGTVSGTPTTTGSYTFTVEVTDSAGGTDTQSISMDIYDPIVITTTSLADGHVGTAYSQTLGATGGSGGYTWTVAVGSLPAGLVLNPSTGVISGTPTSAGTVTIKVRATDSVGSWMNSADLTITIYSAVAITTSSLPYGVVGSAYSETLAASGGTGSYTTWAIASGSLPAGLTLNSSTGVISGTPTTTGTSSFTVSVTDSAGGTATRSLTIAVYTALSITTATLPGGHEGTAYSQTLAATGGSGTYSAWAVTVGSLPTGLTLASSTGVISGTPSAAGTYTFTIEVTDSVGQTATRALSIVVYTAVTVTTASLPFGTTATAYSQTLAASGGTGTYSTWAVTTGSLPAGLTLNASTGVISGTPTGSGTATFTVRVTDSAGGMGTRSLTLLIYGPLTVTTTTLANGTVGYAYSQTLAASGGNSPYTAWAITSGTLPAGLTLAASTGVISGTPTTPGTYSFTVQVTDSSAQTATKALTITVGYPPLAITTSSLSNGTVSAAYAAQLNASGGAGSYVWSVIQGTIPPGVSLNASTGGLSGTPSQAGTFTISVQVTDASGATAVKAFTLTIFKAACPTDPNLNPINNPQNANIPVGGVAPGGMVILDCGTPVPYVAQPQPATSPVAMQVSAFGFWLQIEGRSDRSAPLGLAGNSVLVLQSSDGARAATARGVKTSVVQPTALVSGAGVQPNSPVKVYLLPSTYLGTLTASASGAFSGSVPIPNGLAPGSYTLQANATGTDAQVRSVSMGVIMQRSAGKPASGTATVRFAMMSSELTKDSKAALRNLVSRMGTSGVRSVVLGYVQRAGGSWNNKSLSSSRASKVAGYLRTLGVQGSMAAQGKGVDPATPGPYGRRVDITIVATG